MEKVFGNLKDEALRYDEIYMIWTHVSLNNGHIATNHSFFKHVRDKDLKAIILESIQCLKNENKLLEEVLIENGITLPPTPFEYPNIRIEDMRARVSVSDTEISAVLSMMIATGLVTSSQAMELSIKNYITMMYGQFHMKKAILGAKLLQLSTDKGWLTVTATIF